jgi:hypothetical protein
MKREAVDKAKKRMKDALDYFMALDGEMTYEQFEQRWSSFLNAINRAFLAIEAGARDNARTRTWWSKKKHEWKKDPLLQYLHQARNADEHGLEPLSKMAPGYFTANPPPGINPKSVSHPRLVPVRNDRFGDVFDPPVEHLGQNLHPEEIGLPWDAAAMAMGYHSRLIIEAETYIDQPFP